MEKSRNHLRLVYSRPESRLEKSISLAKHLTFLFKKFAKIEPLRESSENSEAELYKKPSWVDKEKWRSDGRYW